MINKSMKHIKSAKVFESGKGLFTPEELDEMSLSENPIHRRFVAMSDIALPITLERLSEDPELDVRVNVADNPNSPEKALRRVYDEKDEDSGTMINKKLARNPNTPVDILIDLSKHPFTIFRVAVAQNPSLPMEDLVRMLEDPNELVVETVKRALAEDTDTDPGILIDLSRDESESVRRRAKENPNLPDPTEWAFGDW
ncbi:hypothetical protein UFOVP699_140 [uncultured Caudovirales phage]|uniref:Leucine rich repeat variant n=1 Tax=uncultured Caudovirales phage TaxID=2100421 RepID=A0A6J5NW00_9CAUD|nr:hypothetical protein UFOVP699_140 [uncultured Caudovirales phage]